MEEALDSLRVMGSASLDAKTPPSRAQALVGRLTAGVIALTLYKFTTTVEATFSRQAASDNFSVRTTKSHNHKLAWSYAFMGDSEGTESTAIGKSTLSNSMDENSSGDSDTNVSSSREEQSSNDAQ